MLHLVTLVGIIKEKCFKRDLQPLEGVIKFQFQHTLDELTKAEKEVSQRVTTARDFLFKLELIGVYKDGPTKGFGYGNVSCLTKRSGVNGHTVFCVTGTQTGRLPELNPEKDTTMIDEYDSNFHVKSRGPSKPSSESLTHAALYDANPDINAVIHIHSRKWWSLLLERENVACVGKDVMYGSPEMADEVGKLVRWKSADGLIVTAGHEDGVFFYGQSLAATLQLLMKTGLDGIDTFSPAIMEEFDKVIEKV